MARPRFFLSAPLAAGEDVFAELPETEVHHLTDVLRARPGDEIVLVEPGGSAWQATVVSLGGGILRVSRRELLPVRWEPHVTLVAGIAKGSKIDDAVEGAVEVGVEAVWPVLTARSIVKLDPRKRAERGHRWRRVALAAAKQSQRASVPDVAEPADLRDVVAPLAAFDLTLVAWEEAEGLTVRDAIVQAKIPSDARVAIIVGPEGGLTAAEVDELERIGAVAVTLGPTILRAETAGVVAPAIVITVLGELHGREESA